MGNWAKLLSLDVFLGREFVRPFHLAASALALMLTASGLLIGLALMAQSFVIGLFVALTMAALGVSLLLGARLLAEIYIATSRMHERFIGGEPRDPIPPP